MTDFLSRVAARAVGATAAARPRVAGLFEPPDAADAPLEIVDEVVASAASPARQARAATPVASASASLPPIDEPLPEPPRHVDPTVAPALPAADSVARSNYAPAAASEVRRLAPEPRPTPDPPAEQSVAAPAVVPAAPLAQTLPIAASREAAAPPPAAAREEEPPVRVHIGRLEIRADVQPPTPPERPRREPPGPEGLSLADYLRGKREVRS